MIIQNDIEDFVNDNEKLIDKWGKRNPRFEKKYEDSVMRVLSTYGQKATEFTETKGKILGPGYEPYIMAFFIGLYSNKRIPLSENSDDCKVLGQPLSKWGHGETKQQKNGNIDTSLYFRHTYPKLINYIFISLVAKTEVDWIALDKGDIKVSSVITALINTMEEYANYGFSVMEDKLHTDPGYFFSHRSFLDIFLQLTNKQSTEEKIEEPEEL